MNETITVLVAAFGGGLVGSILQPLVEHYLSRARRIDKIRKQRERRLRQMIEDEMDFVRHAVRLLAFDQVRASLGATPDTLGTSARLADARSARAIWQPNRISDPALRELAEEMADLPLRFAIELGTGVDALKRARDQIGSINDRCSTLQDAISKRMDELNWPEQGP